MLISVDPGRVSGIAYWHESSLTMCGLLSDLDFLTSPREDVVWIESQVIYPHSKADPNDILTLAREAGRVAGSCAAAGATVHWVKPSEWKGQLPKDVCHRRIRAVLTAKEQVVLARDCRGMPASKRHNVLDAVGIGLWALRRR